MAKFLGVLCTLAAALCLVGAVDAAAARNLTSGAFVEELGGAALEDPEARDEIADEIIAWLDDQPAREAALQTAFGDEWEEPMREIAVLAVQTPEFETAYLEAAEQARDTDSGENSQVTVDLGPTVAAVRPQLDPSVSASLDLLPPGFFAASDTIDTGDLDQVDDFNQVSRQVLVWASLGGFAAGVLSIALFRSPLPLAWVGAIAVGLALLQFALLRALKAEGSADYDGALERIGTETVLDSLARSTLVPLMIVGVTLFVISLVTNKAMASIRSNAESAEMPTGSDTDWADSSDSDGFPQIIS